MGGVCARCSNLEKRSADAAGRPQNFDDLEDEAEELGLSSEDERSSVALSSEDGAKDEEKFKEGVQQILKDTGKNLVRGKTLAMKEAISAAKTCGVKQEHINEAESRLDDHKVQQVREDQEIKVDAWFASDQTHDETECERLLLDARKAGCGPEVLNKLRTHYDLLRITRPLEPDEVEQAKEYVRQSCRDFWLAATSERGRSVLMLDLDAGRKIPSYLALNEPLQKLILKAEPPGEGDPTQRMPNQEAPLCYMKIGPAREDEKVRKTFGFLAIEKEDGDYCVAMRFQGERKTGMWCFVEPSIKNRDRFIEAVNVFSSFMTHSAIKLAKEEAAERGKEAKEDAEKKRSGSKEAIRRRNSSGSKEPAPSKERRGSETVQA